MQTVFLISAFFMDDLRSTRQNEMFPVPRRELTKALYLQSVAATTKLVYVIRIQKCSNIRNKLIRKLLNIAATVMKLSGHRVYILQYVQSITYITELHCTAYDGLQL